MAGILMISAVILWQNRLWLDTDTVTYADMSDALLRGDWREAVNGYFSPAWAFLIAVARWMWGADAPVEAPLVRAVQWILSIGSVLMARRFLGELRHWTAAAQDDPAFSVLTLPGTVLFWTGTLLAIDRLALGFSNPDVLLTFLALGASGEILAIQRTQATRRAISLGAWIAAMYWTKGVALPLGLGFCAAAALMASRESRARIVLSVTMAALSLSAPLVIALSLQQQRLDVGDAGRLTMAWFTAGTSSLTPDPRAKGTESLVHPWTQVVDDPPLYVYEGGQPGTYPPWRDPVYWQSGLSVRPSIPEIAIRIRTQGAAFWNFYVGAMVAGICIAAAVLGGLRAGSPRVTLALAMPPALAAASYLPILFEPRYFAPVVLLALASLMTLSPSAGRRWPWLVLALAASVGWQLPTIRELLGTVPVVLILLLASRGFDARRRVAMLVFSIVVVAATIPGIVRQMPGLAREGQQDGRRYEVLLARALAEAGVPEEARVSMVGIVGPDHYDLWWARRARVRIVAEVPRGHEGVFWQAPEVRRQEVLEAMSKAGAQYVVARRPPSDVRMDAAWHDLGSTGFALRPLVR